MASSIDKVVLINISSGSEGIINPGDSYLSFKFIEEGLRAVGFHNLVKFPSKPLSLFEMFYGNGNRLMEELHNSLRDDWNIMFGLPVMTETYWAAEVISGMIRRDFPFSTIVAGGNHIERENIFDRDGIRCFDAVDIALLPQQDRQLNVKKKRPFANFAVTGHMQPFIELVMNDGRFNKGIEGLYTLKEGQVVGAGKGKLPKLNHVPISYIDQKISGTGEKLRFIFAQLRSSCPNSCKYCATTKGISFPVDMAVEGLERVLKGIPVTIINLTDPNPMAKNSVDYYLELLDKLRGKGIKPYVQCYLDPSLLVDEKYFKELINIFKDYLFISYFIGMDCVNQEVAGMMGRNLQGRFRTQQEFDAEQEAVKRFISELKSFNLLGGRHFSQEMILSYIVTPFDSYDTTLRTINQAEQFRARSNGYVKVDARIGTLMPYPGTALRKEYAHHIKDPEDFNTHNDQRNPWSLDMGPQAKFLEYGGLFSRRDYKLMREYLNEAYKKKSVQ
ncbi:hypothetical protein HY636_06135 [Candidatus Woesearchaeota archaeon]|nr:hypothetical protein [Candidatus Woesearchaeota archaeon]